MAKILVTGGAGFMGSHLVKHLAEQGHYVMALDNLEIGKREYVHEDADFYNIDLTDECAVRMLIEAEKPEVIYHLAAHAAEGQSVFTPCYTVQSNMIGFLNLFTSILNEGFETFVFTSSMAVYGDQSTSYSGHSGQGKGYRPEGTGFKEDMPRKPVDPYGITKADIERYLELYSKEFGFNYVIIRPHNVYGPNQSLSNPYRNVMGIWMNRIMHGKPPIIYGTGEQTRAFTYIDDVTHVIAESAWNKLAYGEIFNIGSDEVHTVNHAADVVMNAMNFKERAIHAPERPMEVKHAWCNQEKAKAMLKYNPAISLEDGVQLMADWATRRGPEPFKYWDENLFDIKKKIPKVWSEQQL